MSSSALIVSISIYVYALRTTLTSDIATDFKALYMAKGREQANLVDQRVRRQPITPAKSLTYRQKADEDWRHGKNLNIQTGSDTGKDHTDRRATVSEHIESDYDDDAKQSVISRLSHTDEDVDQW